MSRLLAATASLFASSFLLSCGEAPPPPPPPRPPAPMESDRPDDGVGVETMGSLDRDRVNQTVRNMSSRLGACYMQGVGRLPFLAGDIRFDVGVALDGSVQWAYVVSTQLGDHAAQQCMLDVIRATAFPQPAGGESHTMFDLSLAPPDAVTYPATWTPNQVAATVEAHRLEIDACLDGSAGYTLTIYLTAGGLVQSTGSTPPDAGHQDQADCLAAAAMTWVLDDPGPAGAKVTLAF